MQTQGMFNQLMGAAGGNPNLLRRLMQQFAVQEQKRRKGITMPTVKNVLSTNLRGQANATKGVRM